MKEMSSVMWQGRCIQAVIFDLDGTLSDSIEAYYQVFREATAKVGIHVKREDVLEPMATGSLIWDRAIPRDIPDRDEKIRQCMSIIPQVFKEVLQRAKPFPGVEDVLSGLRHRGIEIGLVTDSWRAALAPLESHSLARHFRAIVTVDDGFPRKPLPGSIQECLKRMDVDPANAVTVGDSVLDIRAGHAAGTLTVGVLCGIANRQQLESASPSALVGDVTHLLPLLDSNQNAKGAHPVKGGSGATTA
jgi:phosphoglycolate phosphatase